MALSPRTRRLLVFFGTAAAIIALWSTPVLYPVRVFVVLLHELSHGLAAVATGGSIERIVLTADEGGYALTRGGSAFVTLSAGYLGSLGFGAGILALARWRRAGDVVTAMGAVLLALTALYLRSFFAFGFGVLFGAGMLLAGRHLSHRTAAWLLLVLGQTSCMYAPLDIWSDVIDRPYLVSDARMLADMTGVPVLVWGVLWLAISLAVGWRLFRSAVARP